MQPTTNMTNDGLARIRLLLVDDEAHFRQALAKRLSKRGLSAHQAENGEVCLAVLARQPMDVVVMDVKMPVMDGMAALRQVKRLYAETEVILLTGHAATQDGVEGIKAGAFDYLTKPVEFDHLLMKIVHAYEKIQGIKQKKEAEAYRARVKQQMIATERLAALGTLAAGVAHEINNPLAIIKESAGYLSALMAKPELVDMPRRESFEKALQKIDTSVKRARNITHQLLGDVRQTDMVIGEVDLPQLVEETIGLVRREAADKEIAVRLEAPPHPPAIMADPHQLRQVLINLLSNAIHATSAGGDVVVELKYTSGDVCIAVVDSGSGISKENLDKIFEPFFSTKSPGEGTGLGLFVTREIVDKLGGTLSVDSRLGQGATFRVVLPVPGA